MRRAFLFLIAAVAIAFASGGLSGPSGALAAPNGAGVDHDGGGADVNAGPAMVAPGATVTVRVVLQAPPENLAAWTLNVRYDPDVLAVDSCTGQSSSVCNPAWDAERIRIAGASAIPGLSGTFSIAEVTFEATGFAGTCSQLVPEIEVLVDGAVNPVPPLFSNGMVCIEGTRGVLGIDHNGGALDINAGPADAVAGGLRAVKLIVEAPPEEVGAWTVDIHYDSAVIVPVSCVPHHIGVFATSICNPGFGVMEIRVTGADATGLGGTFNLADITFRAEGAVGDCSSLGVEAEILADIDGTLLVPVTHDGQVCVTQPCADVTGDGRVTLRDLAAIALRIALRRYEARFDLNGDGVINRLDFGIALSQLGTAC